MHLLGNPVAIVRKSSPASSWRGIGIACTLLIGMAGCARQTASSDPVQLVDVMRDGAPALAVFHEPDVRINALSPPVLALDGQPSVKLDRGAQTADSAYFAEPPWLPRGTIAGSGKMHVSFCRSNEAYCTVHSYPVTVK